MLVVKIVTVEEVNQMLVSCVTTPKEDMGQQTKNLYGQLLLLRNVSHRSHSNLEDQKTEKKHRSLRHMPFVS